MKGDLSMKHCIITLIKFDKEFLPEFGVKEILPCPMHKVGQIFYTNSAKPDDLCSEVWRAIEQYVFTLAEAINIDNCKKKSDVAICICNCNNALRPMIFQITVYD